MCGNLVWVGRLTDRTDSRWSAPEKVHREVELCLFQCNIIVVIINVNAVNFGLLTSPDLDYDQPRRLPMPAAAVPAPKRVRSTPASSIGLIA